MFSSVNLNLEFSYFYKMGWELRIKKYIYGRLYNTGGLGQFADLRGVLAKKGVGVFEGG